MHFNWLSTPSISTTVHAWRYGADINVCFYAALRAFLGETYAKNVGFNEVAELNNIIMVYPQAAPNIFLGNPVGCWDMFGFTGDNYGRLLYPWNKLGSDHALFSGTTDNWSVWHSVRDEGLNCFYLEAWRVNVEPSWIVCNKWSATRLFTHEES